MDEQKVRQIVAQMLQADKSNSRFGFNMIPVHAHTGLNDGSQITQNSILASSRLEGSITLAHTGIYKIATNFNPVAVWVHGNVTGASGEKFITVGNAQLGGGSFYLQPGTDSSVTIGGPPQNIIQSCTYFGGTSGLGGSLHTVVDEGHIVDVEYPLGTIFARATVSSFSRDYVYVNVETLTSGWELNLSFTIT